MNSKLLKVIMITIGIIGLFLGYKIIDLNASKGNNFDKCITLTITINEDISNSEYCTNVEFLGELVDEYHEDFYPVFTGNKSNPFGRLLVEINGYTLEGNEFFFIYVNEEYGRYGIDQQPIEDGITYELRLGTY